MSEERIRLRRNPKNVAVPQGSDDLYFDSSGNLIHESPGGVKETVGGSTVNGIEDVPGLAAELDAKRDFSGYTRIAYLGDSLSERNATLVTNEGRSRCHSFTNSYPFWLETYADGKLEPVRNIHPNVLIGGNTYGVGVYGGWDFGFGGNTAAQLIIDDSGRIAPTAMLNESISREMVDQTLVLVMAGTNDIVAGSSGATTAASVIAIWDRLETYGFNYVPIAILPGSTVDRQTRTVAANTILAAEAAVRGLVFIPQLATLISSGAHDPAYSTDDQIHQNSRGAQLFAQHVWGYISPYCSIRKAAIPPSISKEWVSPNTHFLSGSPLASGWIQISGTLGSATITPSIITDSGGRWQRFVQSGKVIAMGYTAYSSNSAVSFDDGYEYRLVGRIRGSGGAFGGIGLDWESSQGNHYTCYIAGTGDFGTTERATETASVAVVDVGDRIVVSSWFTPELTSGTPGGYVYLYVIGNGTVDFQGCGVIRRRANLIRNPRGLPVYANLAAANAALPTGWDYYDIALAAIRTTTS